MNNSDNSPKVPANHRLGTPFLWNALGRRAAQSQLASDASARLMASQNGNQIGLNARLERSASGGIGEGRSSDDKTPNHLESEEASLVVAIEDVFRLTSVRHLAAEANRSIFAAPGNPGAGYEFRGKLIVPADAAFDLVSKRFRELGFVCLFRKAELALHNTSAPLEVIEPEHSIFAVPGEIPESRGRYALAAGLFILTFISVLFTGAINETGLDSNINLLLGLPFAVSLLAILGAHEMGHFLMARRLGVPSSPPFFIPMPLTLFGTMGAVMQMKAPPKDRGALMRVGIAGPLAGLVVCLPVLIVGLLLSEVRATPIGVAVMQEGNSLLYFGLKYLVFAQPLPANGIDVFLHPVALAGWAGLLVTGLNLMPAGQLDGGHVAYVLFGRRAKILSWAVLALLLGLSIFWQGWLLWAGLIFLFGRTHAIPLNDITPLSRSDRAIAWAMLALFVLVFSPIPMIIT